MAAPPGASPGNHHAAAVRRRPCGPARSPRSRPRGSNAPVPLRSGRQSPSLTRRAPQRGSTSARPTTDPRMSHAPASAGCACVATTIVVATAAPQGRAPPPGGGGLRCDQRPVSRAAAGVRPASWSGTGPWPARVGGTGALRRNGDFVRESVRTCVAAGVLGLFARASLSILSSAAPLSVVRALSRADSGRRGGTEGRGRGSPVPAGTAKASGSRACASWQPPAAQAPTDRSYSTATTPSTEGVTWICSRCSVPWNPDSRCS